MLLRKMLRDIKNNLSQFITIFLMVMIGVMAFSGIEAYMDGMQNTADKFYSENNLEDLILQSKPDQYFTKEDLEKIKELDNINDAERKMSITALTDNDKTLLLNLIETNNISIIYPIEGEGFIPNKKGVWLDNYYAIENDLKVGDTIHIKYENINIEEPIIGLVNVPDHLYDVRDSSELYPDRKEFGFAYINSSEFPEENIKYSTIMVDLDNKDDIDKTKNDLEKNIPSILAMVNVEDTASYTTYQGEIDEGKTYVGVFSGLFIFIAMLSVITTMTRVVKKQRIQIGTLKALGFKDYRILLHYIGYGFWISLFASICGIILGYFIIGKIFINLEMDFFEIPNGKPLLNYKSYIVATLVTLVVSLITYLTCKNILKEKPAEALRNKIPNVKKNSLNITTKGFIKKLNFSNKWNIRDIIRNKMRTFMGLAGVTGCCMLIVCAFGMLDSMNYFVDLQFEQLYNFDYKLVIKTETSTEDIQSLENKYGNNTSQSIGIEIIDGEKRDSNMIFVTDANNYIRFVDKKGKYTNVDNDNGIYVTYKLAQTNGYKLGDTIKWHIYGLDYQFESEIVGFNKDPQNQIITMTRKYYESLEYEIDNEKHNLEYKPDAIYTNEDLSNVKEIENIESIQNIEALKDGMTQMLSMMKTMLILIIVIAILLGAIIIYNLGILSYTEKQYQFATLKVLGFKDKKIKKIFITQNNWIAILSIIIGCPLGYYLTDWLFKTAIEEHYDFGASITLRTYIIGALGTFIVSYLVSKFLSRKVSDIDMVTSLKGNE